MSDYIEELDIDIITSFHDIPYFMLDKELSNESKKDYQSEVEQIKKFYAIYKKGCSFTPEGSNGDYEPSMLRFKKAAAILNKEARFLFANTPTFNVNMNDVGENEKKANAIIQSFLDKVLEKNNFAGNILKAGKDCFIGRRIAIVLNFNEKSGITLTFLNSLSFVYETTGKGTNELTKLITFHEMEGVDYSEEQRWFKKVYSLENGSVYVEEVIYNGLGIEIETVTKKTKTKFSYIPAVVVTNEGLLGDIKGRSELEDLKFYEAVYSKLSNADIDAERKNMNAIRYAIDASQESTSNLSTAPGSFWDIQSDDTKAEEKSAKIGQLESNMSYSTALKTTLDRIENTMYSEVDVPNINSEQLQGVITSGKTLKALYWGLTVRCDEKMLSWAPALQFIANAIIEGGRLYPKTISKYTTEKTIPFVICDIIVENNYALPEDEQEEKEMDIQEVEAKLMSRKAYLKKWRKLNDKEADEELMQIKAEQDLFENSQLPPYDNSSEQDNNLDINQSSPEDAEDSLNNLDE